MILALSCLASSIFCGIMTAKALTTHGRTKQPDYGEAWTVKMYRQIALVYSSFAIWLLLLISLKISEPEHSPWTFWAVLSAFAGPVVAIALGYRLKVKWGRYEATWPVRYDHDEEPVERDIFLHDPQR